MAEKSEIGTQVMFPMIKVEARFKPNSLSSSAIEDVVVVSYEKDGCVLVLVLESIGGCLRLKSKRKNVKMKQ